MYGTFLNGHLQVVVDDKEPANITHAKGSLLDLDVFYASPLLDNAMHKVIFRNVIATKIDYALVGVEKDTPLLEHKIIVGSDDPDIQYQGPWSRNATSIRDFTNGLHRRPFGNSTAQTNSNVTTTFQFQFYGTSISVVGAASLKDCATLWIFDGLETVIGHVGQDKTRFEWFSRNSILLSSHTLEFGGISSPDLDVTVTFTLEYIIYTPSRSTLDAPPNGMGSPGSTSSSSTGSNPTITPIKPPTAHRLSAVGITSVVIGAVAGVAAVFLVLIIFVQMKRRGTKIGSIEQVPVHEILPDNIIQHKSSIPRITVGQANTIEMHYILPIDASGGIEHRGLVQRIMGAITRRSGLTRAEPYRGFSHWVRLSDLMVQHKPPLSDTHNVSAINQPIREARNGAQDEDDNTIVTGTETVVAQEGDAMSRAEHLRRLIVEEGDAVSRAEQLRRLIVEFQQEFVESVSVTYA
ncbi:hypothetical protein DXG01_001467 [Tephrocybe rancida]|nr:hypothetical protein DXG01_001467 [Tephrocybe rancida]